jgi:ribosomal protein S8E
MPAACGSLQPLFTVSSNSTLASVFVGLSTRWTLPKGCSLKRAAAGAVVPGLTHDCCCCRYLSGLPPQEEGHGRQAEALEEEAQVSLLRSRVGQRIVSLLLEQTQLHCWAPDVLTSFLPGIRYELGRQAAMTKLSSNVCVRRVRVRGGNSKFRALRLDHGNFSWGSEVGGTVAAGKPIAIHGVCVRRAVHTESMHLDSPRTGVGGAQAGL